MALTYNRSQRTLSIKGVITRNDGSQITIGDADVVMYTSNADLGYEGVPLGATGAASYTLQLDNVGRKYTPSMFDNAEVHMWIGILENDEFVYSDFGVWYVESCVAPEQSVYITLYGSDALATKFTAEYGDSGSYPTTIGSLLTAVCVAAGIRLKAVDFPNAAVSIQKKPNWFDATTLRDIVSYCAICAGGFARIAMDGQLEILSYADGQSYEVDPNLYKRFSLDGGSEFKFNAIEAKLTEDAEEYDRYAVDSSIADNATNTIQLDYNPLLTDKIVQSVVTELKNVRMESGTLEWVGDPSVKCGDYFETTTLNGTVVRIMATSLSFVFNGGLSSTVECSLPSTNTVNGSSYSSAGSLYDSNGNIRVTRISGLDGKIISATTGHFEKLTAGEVAADRLTAALIETLNLRADVIDTGSIETDALTAFAAKIIQASIDKLDAGTVEADVLYSALATIAVVQITTADIDWAAIKTLTAEIATISKASLKDADIEWADIETLNAVVASVADARIKNASITTAQISDLRAEIAKVITLSAQDGKFDFASIRDLLAKAMILEQGVAGSVYIKNLVATQASFVGATLGSLVLKGEDGKYYSVTVQSDGTIHTQQTTVTDTEISAGQTSDGRQIVATDANIANLNASTIKAESAIIADIYVGALTAGKISASEALIASATVPELYVTSIQAIGDSMDLSANKSIRLLLGSRNANHRSETPPVDANVNDLWVRPSTGYTYQRVAESEELPIFVVETEKGDLFYRYDDGITVYDLRMDASGDLYIDEKAPFAVSVNGGETMYWLRVKDSDIARVELLLTEDSIVATVRGSAAYQQDMERVDAAQGSADKAYGEAAQAKQDALDAMNEIAAKAQEIVELETKITQLASEIELRVRQDDLSTYLKLLIEGVQIGRNDSEYNVLIANTGMFIRQFSDVIASFAKRQLTSPAVRIANPADTDQRCVLRTAADGGMMIVSEEAIQ